MTDEAISPLRRRMIGTIRISPSRLHSNDRGRAICDVVIMLTSGSKQFLLEERRGSLDPASIGLCYALKGRCGAPNADVVVRPFCHT